MKKILLAGHGKFAEGLKSAISLIAGDQETITFINAYVGDKNFEEVLDEYLATITDEDTLIVMTDLFGGSVNQTILRKLDLNKSYLITGVNLAVLLELALTDVDNINKEKIQEVVQSGKDQLMLVELEKESDDEDFDF